MPPQTDTTPMTLVMETGVARLTFTQAARGNPIDGAFASALLTIARKLSVDPTVRVVLVEAEGKAFSYGGDIAAFTADLDDLAANVGIWARDLNAAIVLLQQLNAPIVVAAFGVCAGGMAAFVAGADVVVGAPDIAFVAAWAGIGFCCDAGGSTMLARRMGGARARRYMILNETIAGDDALTCGLVDEIVAREELPTRALAIARRIAGGPTRAFGEIRRLMLGADGGSLADRLEAEVTALERIAATADAREGITAFAAKRRATFTGV